MRAHLAILWIGVSLLVFSQLAGFWAGTNSPGAAAFVDAQRHFRALLPPQATDILHVIQTAQERDYWIRIQTGLDVTYLKGQASCTACDPAQEAQFFTPPQLYVDGLNFWVRTDEENWRMNLRPAYSMPMAYEVIVSPKLPRTEISPADLDQIASRLRSFGLNQTASLSFEPLIPIDKPEPPEGARIDSVLYGLLLAPDWKDYASANGIDLSGLRARVIVELSSSEAELPDALQLVVEARTGNLVRVQVLIHRLVELARDAAVSFVRLPSRPQPASR
jgi:hypothetical protein